MTNQPTTPAGDQPAAGSARPAPDQSSREGAGASPLAGIITGRISKPRRCLVYGVPGIGKTTFAADAPSPIVIQTEDGCDALDVPRFPLAGDLPTVFAQIAALIGEPHDFRTLVIDSLSALERLVWASVCSEAGVPDMERVAYGKLYRVADEKWKRLIRGLDKIRARGLHVVMIAHSEVRQFDDPARESYSRYIPALHKGASAIVQGWCDEVLFATFEVYTRTEDQGFGQTKTKAIGDGQRVLYTSERPSHLAKNRLGMPDSIPLAWAEYARYFEASA